MDNIKKILATVGVVGGWIYLSCFKPVYLLIIGILITIIILITIKKT